MKKLFWNFISLFGTLGAGLLAVVAAFVLDTCFGWVVFLNLVIITIASNTWKVYHFKPRPDNPEGYRPDRPFNPLEFRKFLSIKNSIGYFHYVDAGSFPSIHSARSFNQAALFSIYFGNLSIALLLFLSAALVAWSRVVKLRHFKTDIAAGMVLGLIVAGLSVVFID